MSCFQESQLGTTPRIAFLNALLFSPWSSVISNLILAPEACMVHRQLQDKEEGKFSGIYESVGIPRHLDRRQ
jgi:hypothetical protein